MFNMTNNIILYKVSYYKNVVLTVYICVYDLIIPDKSLFSESYYHIPSSYYLSYISLLLSSFFFKQIKIEKFINKKFDNVL